MDSEKKTAEKSEEKVVQESQWGPLPWLIDLRLEIHEKYFTVCMYGDKRKLSARKTEQTQTWQKPDT